MKKKIFFYYMVLTIIAVTVTVFFTSQIAQKYYKSEIKDKLISTASLINLQIADELSKGEKVDYDKLAHKYSQLLEQVTHISSPFLSNRARVTFIDLSGKVVGESDADFTAMENHSNRKEIQEAFQGKVGEDIRYSKTLRIDFLYIAIPAMDIRLVTRISVPLIQLRNIDQIMWYYSIVGIIIGLVLTALLALKFSGSITRPINELIKVANDISAGNYSKRVNIKTKGELGELAYTFNSMASELEKTVADLTDKNLKVDSIINSMVSGIVAVDNKYKIILINSMACQMFGFKNGPGIIGINIIELIRNNHINNFLKESVEKNIYLVNDVVIGPPEDKVLRIHTSPIKSKESASINSGGIIFIHDITNVKKLEQIRTEFVSNVTHELKTPLTSIRGFIETLRSGAINDSNVADRFLEIIDIEAERLYMLINDILQLSEIESKQKDTNISSHNLKTLVEETLSILDGLAEKKGIIVTSEVDESISIIANKDRIKQMLINLIENGIKYNVENGRIHIKAGKAEGKITISIKDTGIGIPPEHLSRIFERFYRVDKGRSRNMGGTGLGLSIVKHIVNLYCGDIKVNSEPGSGTEFIIRLPV